MEKTSPANSLLDIPTGRANIGDLYRLAKLVCHAVQIPRSKQKNPILLLTYDQEQVSHYTELDYLDMPA